MAKAPWGIFFGLPSVFAGMLPWKLLMVMATAEWEFNEGGGGVLPYIRMQAS